MMHCFSNANVYLHKLKKRIALFLSCNSKNVLTWICCFCCICSFSQAHAEQVVTKTKVTRSQSKSVKQTKRVKQVTKKNRTAKTTHKIVQKNKQIKLKQIKKISNKTKIKPAREATPVKRIPMSSVPAVPQKINLVSSIQQKLVNFVQNTVDNIRYSAYKLGGTRFDPARGIYVVDCSSYVDRVLKTVHPRAFSKLVNYSGNEKPTTHDYYSFFTNLTDEPKNYWDTVDDVAKLRPGDLLVFRYRNEPESVTKGHIVIVMEKPIRNKDTFRVRIADAAPVRHSQDTRMPRVSGIGIGTMLLKVNPKTYRPFAYAWGLHSKWERNVRFAMARPIDLRS